MTSIKVAKNHSAEVVSVLYQNEGSDSLDIMAKLVNISQVKSLKYEIEMRFSPFIYLVYDVQRVINYPIILHFC